MGERASIGHTSSTGAKLHFVAQDYEVDVTQLVGQMRFEITVSS